MIISTLLVLGFFDSPDAKFVGGIRDQIRANSVDWTGIEERAAASPELTSLIRAKIEEVDKLVERVGLTNSEHVQAKRATESLLTLITEPKPPWKVIAELLVFNLWDLAASKQASGLSNIITLLTALAAMAKLIFGSSH